MTSTSCTAGVPNLISCSCIVVNGCEEFNQVSAELENITDTLAQTGNTTQNITDAISEIESYLDDFAQYCLNHTDTPVNQTFISAQLQFIRMKLSFLNITVTVFKNSLKPNNNSFNSSQVNASWVTVSNPTAAPCPLQVGSCNGSTITNLKTCTCSLIIGWDLLPNITNALPNLLTQIQNLTTESQQTLIDNWNLVNSSIPDLEAYVVNYSSNLDEIYLQAQTNQIITWYQSIVDTIRLILLNSGTLVCDIVCPNYSSWVYDSTACSCSCNITGCPIENAIDYFNCGCVPKNLSCNVTQDQCQAIGGALLDYAECACKPHP